MKKVLFSIVLIAVVFLIAGCNSQENISSGKDESKNKTPMISTEEKQRMDLYIAVMKEAFQRQNGGNKFIAVQSEKLEGLSEKAKIEVFKELNSLSANVFSFEDVKNDKTKFKIGDNERLERAIDGTVLHVEVWEYSENKAIISGVSWFANLAALSLQYEAVFENGVWQLKLINMVAS